MVIQSECALHAVIVPFPAQGHVNPLMNLAQLLATRGFFITFVNTEDTHKRVVEVSARNNNCLVSGGDFDLRGGKIRFLSLSDGISLEDGRPSDLGLYICALQKLGPALEHLLYSSSNPAADADKYSFPPITCIVADAFMSSCTEEVATNMKVPRVVFWPLCAAASIVQLYTTLLISEGHVPVRVGEANNPEKLITCLPGNIPPLRPTDLSSALRAQDPSDIILFNALLYETQMQNKGDYVLVNTFEELEGRDAVTALSLDGCPALAIGPLFLPNFLQGRDSTTSLCEEEESCLQWLDMQEAESVIYVSFGSVAVKSQEQLEQLALGLEGSGQPFLWVLRSDLAEGKPAVLPDGFEERTRERALLVGWAPQVKVLAHTSVGLFVTHGGWNSTLEAIGMGVPVVGLPSFADQSLNSRFAKEVWEIGLEFERVDVDDHKVVPKEEVEELVKRMIKTSEGKQLRKNVLKLKECATRAVHPGGSSFKNLNTFVKDMASKAEAQCQEETK